MERASHTGEEGCPSCIEFGDNTKKTEWKKKKNKLLKLQS